MSPHNDNSWSCDKYEVMGESVLQVQGVPSIDPFFEDGDEPEDEPILMPTVDRFAAFTEDEISIIRSALSGSAAHWARKVVETSDEDDKDIYRSLSHDSSALYSEVYKAHKY